MDMSFTAVLWLNWIIAGFLFGLGWILISAVYSAILWVLGQRRPAPPAP
jgi:uncharacterized membrane protein YedE/YeeE